MTAIELISKLGGTNECARIAGVKPPSVSEWRARGEIPTDKHVVLAVEAEKRGIAKRIDLRPNDYWKFWPDLAKA